MLFYLFSFFSEFFWCGQRSTLCRSIRPQPLRDWRSLCGSRFLKISTTRQLFSRPGFRHIKYCVSFSLELTELFHLSSCTTQYRYCKPFNVLFFRFPKAFAPKQLRKVTTIFYSGKTKVENLTPINHFAGFADGSRRDKHRSQLGDLSPQNRS